MSVNSSFFGNMPDGKEVRLFTIKNSNGIILQVITLGATLQALYTPDKYGRVNDITVGFDSLYGHLNFTDYQGKVVGRYANRIAGGKFFLDGKNYVFEIEKAQDLALVPQDIVNKALKCVITSGKPFCPDYNNIFKAFTFFAPKDCNMVWVGQDPYPQKGVANGILFANKLKTLPEQLSPSLKIIKNSLLEDLQISEKDFNFDPTLESWVKQGILMIS